MNNPSQSIFNLKKDKYHNGETPRGVQRYFLP